MTYIQFALHQLHNTCNYKNIRVNPYFTHTLQAFSAFGHMLLVGAISFEDRFCNIHDMLCTWRLPWLSVEQHWLGQHWLVSTKWWCPYERLPVNILRLLKETAKERGNQRKAHSWRGAAASAAIDQGVTVADIVKTAYWSLETTFTNYYFGVGADKEKYLSTGKEEGSYMLYCTTLLQTYRVTSEACDDMELKGSPGPRSASETISDKVSM